MATIIEAIYEHGVLRPLATEGLNEQHRYRLSIEEVTEGHAYSPLMGFL